MLFPPGLRQMRQVASVASMDLDRFCAIKTNDAVRGSETPDGDLQPNGMPTGHANL